MSKKSKVDTETKANIVKKYLKGKISLEEAGKEVGVHKSVIDDWLRVYQSEGIDGLLPKQRNNIYSIELKGNAITDYFSGKGSLREICKKYKFYQRILRIY